jgi:hypothetical protein
VDVVEEDVVEEDVVEEDVVEEDEDVLISGAFSGLSSFVVLSDSEETPCPANASFFGGSFRSNLFPKEGNAGVNFLEDTTSTFDFGMLLPYL